MQQHQRLCFTRQETVNKKRAQTLVWKLKQPKIRNILHTLAMKKQMVVHPLSRVLLTLLMNLEAENLGHTVMQFFLLKYEVSKL